MRPIQSHRCQKVARKALGFKSAIFVFRYVQRCNTIEAKFTTQTLILEMECESDVLMEECGNVRTLFFNSPSLSGQYNLVRFKHWICKKMYRNSQVCSLQRGNLEDRSVTQISKSTQKAPGFSYTTLVQSMSKDKTLEKCNSQHKV